MHAKPAFPDETAPEQALPVFTDPALRAAEIHFAVHSFQVDSVNITAFALVNWADSHPNRHLLGKPYELWCKYSVRNSFLPIENISCLLVCSQYEFCGEVVQVTVPIL